jgi:hypothetical protein
VSEGANLEKAVEELRRTVDKLAADVEESLRRLREVVEWLSGPPPQQAQAKR